MNRAERALVEREFTIEKIVDKQMQIYRELLGEC